MQPLKHMPTATRALLVAAGGTALLALLSFAPQPTGRHATDYRARLQDCRRLAAADRAEECYTETLLGISRSESPVRALQALEELWDGDAVIRGSCHRIVHAVGSDAFQRLGWSAMAAEDGQVCGYGYKHSVIIGSLQDLREPAAVADLCSGPSFSRSQYRHWHCLHGVGHGLMVANGYDLFRALGECERMRSAFDQETCASGVFMENSVANELPPGEAPPYWQPDEPFSACYRVAERHRPPCFRFQGAGFAIHAADKGGQPATVCQGISSTAYRRECFAGLGGAFAVISDFDIGKTIASCSMVPDGMRRPCLETAAVVFIEQRQNPMDGAGLCRRAPSDLRTSCFSSVGAMIASLSEEGPPQWAAHCREVAGAFADDCLHGANGKPR